VKRIGLPFVGSAYTARSKNLDAQTCINYYLENGGKDSKAENMLIGTPGTVAFADCGLGEGRGIYSASIDRCFAVVDRNLKEILSNGTVIQRGLLDSATGKVSMVDNGIQLMIVDGLKGYIFSMSNYFSDYPAPLTPYVDGDFDIIGSVNFPNGARTVTYADGYFIVAGSVQPTPGLFAISKLIDGFTWDGLEFGSAEGSPDKLVAIIASNRELWALGSRSKEVFYNSEALAFPYDRIQGTFSDTGCLSIFSARTLRGSLFWLGASKDGSASIWMSQGYAPARISTHAIEQDLNQWTDAYAWVYEMEGHAFYVITSNIVKKTWCFDVSTGEWHARMYRDPITGVDHEYNIVDHAFIYGLNLVLHKQSGKVMKLDLDVTTDDGAPIVRRRACQHASSNGDRITFNSIFLDYEVAVGSPYGGDPSEAKNPVVRLRYSDDNAKTWSDPLIRPLGKAGQTKIYVEFRRLGTTRDRVFEIETSAQVKHALIKAGAELQIE
jgi:hypothetical protein